MPHCAALSGELNHDRLDEILDLRDHLWERSRNINFGGSWRTAKFHKITSKIRQDLHKACDYFLSKPSIKFSILQDTIYIYSNEYAVRDELVELGFSIDQITTVKLNRPINTVRSTTGDVSLRCYFKQVELTDVEHENLNKFLTNNKEHVRPSRGLIESILRNDIFLRNYFFIDFKDEKLISVLELMTPNLIRKIMPIVK